MKKKSGHRRRTKVARRSRKNLRRTVKRKRLGKGRRRPTRRYSRVQRGGLTDEELTELEELKEIAKHEPMLTEELKKLIIKAKPSEELKTRIVEAHSLYGYKPGAQYKMADAQSEMATAQSEMANAQHELSKKAGNFYKVGQMYEKGAGVAQDYGNASKFYKLAANCTILPRNIHFKKKAENEAIEANDLHLRTLYKLQKNIS